MQNVDRLQSLLQAYDHKVEATMHPTPVATLCSAKNGDVAEGAVSVSALFADKAYWTWEAACGPGEDNPFAADWKP